MPHHVLLVTVDHWPGALLGAAGHPAIQTPTLDQLARCGVRYPRAYSECPVCIPARRTLLTGLSPRGHGDRTFVVDKPLPERPTLADAFRGAGYQTFAVGKLHVYPPRSRAGFDDVILCEEGRPQMGPTDDYEIYLGEQGLVGQQFLHGMSNNDYVARPWHLAERHHVTNWITREMARQIQRRDPTRPGFWYLSYTHPHPPLAPLRDYLEMYRDTAPPPPAAGSWPRDPGSMPGWMNNRLISDSFLAPEPLRAALRAVYALCTHIDHQLRVVLGTLREERLLDDTVILFASDHGDMLGDHGLWAKRLFYEGSARVPLLLVGAAGDPRCPAGAVDSRLVALQDVMPTLLDLAGAPIPAGVEGLSMVGDARRETLYGEYGEGLEATRMLHDGRHKLIVYALEGRCQLFDLETDPREETDRFDDPGYADVRRRLLNALLGQLYGNDDQWAGPEGVVGLPRPPQPPPDRTLSLQRGRHWPEPPRG